MWRAAFFLEEPPMSDKRAATGPLPVVPFLKIPDDGAPYLEGCVCKCCDTTFLGQRAVCSKCGARDKMETRRLSNEGTLYAYSIVHRSFPGVAVPYVSAIVDLDGGGSIKGNLIHVEPDPKQIPFGLAVEVVYGDALGRKDSEGNAYLSYFFQPRSQPALGSGSSR
jgi:uncharacterized OB-fold protein